MHYIQFDHSKKMDMVLVGRATIDLNPEDMYRPLSESTSFKKYLGGSPANVAVGLSKLGKQCGFIGRVSDDQFGDFVLQEFRKEGVDVSRVKRCTKGEKLGLTFTEVLSTDSSSILMYRDAVADLSLSVEDIDEEYIANAKSLLLSGVALSKSPSREAVLKAMVLARKNNVPIIFDIDYRPYSWENADEIALYYAMVAAESTVIMGSREEYDLTESLLAPGLDDLGSAALWHGHKAKIVVIKHGKKGSTAYTDDGNSYSIKPFPTTYLKGFGGGDGYGSAFLCGLLDGKDIIECLEQGSASASMLIASHGCSPFMPSKESLEAFIVAAKKEHGEMIARG